jgi:hypothetical protein
MDQFSENGSRPTNEIFMNEVEMDDWSRQILVFLKNWKFFKVPLNELRF